jgi:hypothetical protein
MPMPRMRVTNTHGLEIDEIAKLAAHAEKPYTRQALTAVVMTLQGIPAETIAQTLGCSRVSVWRCVDRWILTQSAWSYRYRPSVSASMAKRMEGLSPHVQAIAWKAQNRLHRKCMRLLSRGKSRPSSGLDGRRTRASGIHMGYSPAG